MEQPKAKPWFRVEATGVAVRDSGPLHVYPRHQHLRHELVAVEQGDYKCSINGEKLSASPFSLVAICPGDWHEDVFAPPMRYVALSFNLRRDDAPASSGMRLLRTELDISKRRISLDKEIFAPTLSRIAAENASLDPLASRAIEALIGEFLIHALRAIPPENLSAELLEIVRGEPEEGLPFRLAKLFERRLHGHYSVPEMAKDLGMSESSLAHRCKTELGMAPALAFAKHKMSKAYELLSDTQMNVKQVGDYLGFKNPYHFSRVFKRALRRSPCSVKKKL